MSGALRIVTTAVVVLLLYAAYQRYYYTPGSATTRSQQDLIATIDSLNAGLSTSDVEKFVAEASKSGTLDVDRLGELMRPAARRAGKLAQLERELIQLASGNPAMKPAASNPAGSESTPALTPLQRAMQPRVPQRIPEPNLPENHPRYSYQPGFICKARWFGAPVPDEGVDEVGWFRYYGGAYQRVTAQECPQINMYAEEGMTIQFSQTGKPYWTPPLAYGTPLPEPLLYPEHPRFSEQP